jgi:hypothetical protein
MGDPRNTSELVDEWVAIAACDLSLKKTDRIRSEALDHFEQAEKDGRRSGLNGYHARLQAFHSLGDPLMANMEFKREATLNDEFLAAQARFTVVDGITLAFSIFLVIASGFPLNIIFLFIVLNLVLDKLAVPYLARRRDFSMHYWLRISRATYVATTVCILLFAFPVIPFFLPAAVATWVVAYFIPYDHHWKTRENRHV